MGHDELNNVAENCSILARQVRLKIICARRRMRLAPELEVVQTLTQGVGLADPWGCNNPQRL